MKSHVAGMCLLSQWTSSFPLASRDVLIGIQFECCKSVSYKTIFTLQFTKNDFKQKA